MTDKRHKIAMFADCPAEISPSLWVNGGQFLPWFHDHGWDLELLPPFGDRCTRFLGRTRGLSRLFQRVVLPLKRKSQIRRVVRESDIVVVHKCITSMQDPPIFERRLRSRHSRVIFNYDDAVHERGIPFLAERIALADAVWVGNPLLAEYSRNYCSNVHLIESAVDCDHYVAKTSYVLNTPPRLVWSGTPFSLPYLEILREPLRALRKQSPFVFNIVCRERFTFADSQISEEWTPFSPANETRSLLMADIALMPIVDGAYERAKENYKVKMYLASGLPVVCSPVGINMQFVQSGELGFFAGNSAEWTAQIAMLLNNEALRKHVGINGRRKILKKYALPVIGRQLLDLFENLLHRKAA